MIERTDMKIIYCKLENTKLCYYLINKKFNIEFFYIRDWEIYNKIIMNKLDNIKFKYVYFYFTKFVIEDIGLDRKINFISPIPKYDFEDYFKDYFRNEKLKKITNI